VSCTRVRGRIQNLRQGRYWQRIYSATRNKPVSGTTAPSGGLLILWNYCFLSFIRFRFSILSSSHLREGSILSFRYLSIIRLAIGAAVDAPKPAFSTYTAIAILGSSLGAKAIKIA